MSTVKRPRIDHELADRVDRARDGDAFEAYVRWAVDTAVGRLWMQPDPTAAKRYVVLTDEDAMLAHGLTKRDAEDMIALLAEAHAATEHLTRLAEFAGAVGAPLDQRVEALLGELDDVTDAIRARSYD